MLSRLLSPSIFLFILLLLEIGAVIPQQPEPEGEPVVCTPFGSCQPCPEDSLDEPFCQPFGNRRLVHCVPASDHPSFRSSHTSHSSPSAHQQQHADPAQRGETPAWESCGRIVPQERADFWEFVACNVGFAAVALGVVYVRSRRMAEMQGRQLAARIGMGRRGSSSAS